jgi:glycosyltransferase involved in cell wall biosynthesis
MNKLLTAIIPIGNVNGQLFKLADILSEADSRDVSVIIVHDDFQDGTAEKLETLTKKFDNAKLLRAKLRSPGKARNLGLKNVTTSWFCFWDVDDFPHIKEYTEAIKALKTKSIKVIVGQYSVKDQSTGNISRRLSPKNGNDVLTEIAINPGVWRFIFQSSAFNKYEFGAGSMGEDQLFLARINLTRENILVVEKNFYQYSTNVPGQLTRDKARILELVEVIEEEHALQKNTPASKFIDILILKQSLTLLRYSPSKILRIIKPLITSIFRVNFGVLKFVSLAAKRSA